MGNWNINIQGVGMHHNDKPEDAEKMAAEFALKLHQAGHTVEAATFTYGAKQDILPQGAVTPPRFYSTPPATSAPPGVK